MNFKTIQELEGKTITLVERSDQEVVITTKEGPRYRMWHDQDCCENVLFQAVLGLLDNILNSPVTDTAENAKSITETSESRTDTDYRITTEKGTVVFHWVGESNGYYSESVTFAEIKP